MSVSVEFKPLTYTCLLTYSRTSVPQLDSGVSDRDCAQEASLNNLGEQFERCEQLEQQRAPTTPQPVLERRERHRERLAHLPLCYERLHLPYQLV